MGNLEASSLCLLVSILAPILLGLVLLCGSRFSVNSMRALSVFGFGLPLMIGIMLYGLFDPVSYTHLRAHET